MEAMNKVSEEVRVEGKISSPIQTTRPNLNNLGQFVSFCAV